jgi:hypothetical protein
MMGFDLRGNSYSDFNINFSSGRFESEKLMVRWK